MKITELIKNTARQYADRIATYEEKGDTTYADIWRAVEQKTRALTNAGMEAGMGVGVLGQNGSDFITSALAVMHAEGTVLPISNNLKPEEIDKLCKRTKLHFLWDDESCEIPTSVKAEKITRVEGWRWSNSPHANADAKMVANVEHAALIRFTSGTTGKSKGVILSHQSIIERTACANEVLKLDHEDIVIWVLSMAYHFVVSILLYLRYGSSICICENFMGDYILKRINDLDGTFLYASPMHIRMLNKLPSKSSMPSMKMVISTSMAISADLCNGFHNKFNLPITQAFGIIEVGLPIINTREQDSDPAAIGYALPAYDVKLLNETGEEVEVGSIGQLGIRGPGMFDAYLDPPMLREEALDHGFFLTGDLASRTVDGRITIAGRSKNVINVSGNKAFPEEIEAVINQFAGVAQSRVKGFRHPLLMECVMAEIVTIEGAVIEPEALITFCRKRLSTYKVPQKIVFVDSLEMTDSGKIARST